MNPPSSVVLKRAVWLLCRALLPACTLIVLIWIPGLTNNIIIPRSPFFDLLFRIFLACDLCVAYWQLPVLSAPGIKIFARGEQLRLLNWNEGIFKGLFYANALVYSLCIAGLTWLVLTAYTPISLTARFTIALANAMLFAIFLVPNYGAHTTKLRGHSPAGP